MAASHAALIGIVLIGLFQTGWGLECYVCQNQPNNRDKCVKTTIQCRENQDTCLTRIEWRAPVFWTPRSEKIHYVHKGCNESTFCLQEQSRLGLRCMRDWYRDWECVECCQGDRCNFYVTLAAGTLDQSMLLLIAAVAAALYQYYHVR